jgi:signal peptidase I
MGDSFQDEVDAVGGSMSPFILAGSRLCVERVPVDEIRSGDVVCYIGGGQLGVAHRVIRVTHTDDGVVFCVRGDAQRGEEPVPASAVIAVVRRVEHRWFAYDTGGPIGRAIARIALAESRRTRAAKAAIALGWRALTHLAARRP